MEDYGSHLGKLIKIAIQVGNQLDGHPIPAGDSSLHYAEGLGQKVLHHMLTSAYISDGYSLEGYRPAIDFASVAVLTRAALETYLTFHYLFVSPVDASLKRFRFLSWHIGGFLHRANTEPMMPEHQQMQVEEVARLEASRDELIKNEFYLHRCSQQAKDKALKGDWKIFAQWPTMAVDAGFYEAFFRQQHKYLCGFAHSGRLSVMQIQQVKTIPAQQQMAESFKALLILILGKFLYDYIEVIPALNGFKADTTNYGLICMWKDAAEGIGRPEPQK